MSHSANASVGAATRAAGRIRPVKLAHVVLRTRDRFEQMIDWYRAVLDADIPWRNDFLAFLRYDQEHHRVLIARAPTLVVPETLAVGFDHVAFTYASLGDLLDNYERLKALGILPFVGVDHGITTTLYYRDPDGNKVELQVDNLPMEEAVELLIRMSDINPFGRLIEPEDYLRRYRAGEPEQQMLSQPAQILPPDPALIERLAS